MFVTKNVLDGLENGDLINCIFAKSISPKRIGSNFSNFKTTDPQKFYLDFKNCVAPLIDTEIQRLKKSLIHTSNSYLLLLKITALVDSIIQAAFDSSLWFHNCMLQKKIHQQKNFFFQTTH